MTKPSNDVSEIELIERMRLARTTVNELLLRLSMIRSRASGRPILVVEGPDDVTFYQTVGTRISDRFDSEFLVSEGKPRALKLLAKIRENPNPELEPIKFIFDRDFDELKGEAEGDDTYLLPVYSIENLMACKPVLRKLLNGEFRCSMDASGKELEEIMSWYDARYCEYLDCLKPANRLILYSRRAGLSTGGIDDTLSKYLEIDVDSIKSKVDFAGVSKLIGFDSLPDEDDLAVIDEEFEKLDPEKDWRGKYHYEFLRKVLVLLKQDRVTSTPTLFSRKRNIAFEPARDLVRMLASIVDVPECMNEFFTGLQTES